GHSSGGEGVGEDAGACVVNDEVVPREMLAVRDEPDSMEVVARVEAAASPVAIAKMKLVFGKTTSGFANSACYGLTLPTEVGAERHENGALARDEWWLRRVDWWAI